MSKKRNLIEAARDPIIIKNQVVKKRADDNKSKPKEVKKSRNLLLVSASVLVGFIAGVLVNRYFRIL
jgi:hypothetical protein